MGTIWSRFWHTFTLYNRFHTNKSTDDKQWLRHLDILFPPNFKPVTRHDLTVQYLARVSKLPKDKSSDHYYHKTICKGCGAKIRAFHTMWMQFMCTKCVNGKILTVLTNTLMSRTVSFRFYVVTRTQLKSLVWVHFRDANPQNGAAPRWYMEQHVWKLSTWVWKTKTVNNRNGYRVTRKIGPGVQQEYWKSSRD